MAQRGQTIPGIANGALVARTIVKLSNATVQNGPKQFATCTASDQPCGVVEYDAASGAPCSIIVDGVVKITAAGAIALSANGRTPITSNASGQATGSGPGAGVNSGIVGFLLEPASALGDQVDVLIAPSIYQG